MVAHEGAAGNAGSTISLTANSDRRAELDFRLDGSGPFVIDNNIATAGGNDGSLRMITVGSLTGLSSNQEVRIASLTSNAAGATTTGNNASAIWFDGFNGYRLTVSGATTLTRTLTDFRTRGSLLTLEGIVGGAGASEQLPSKELWCFRTTIPTPEPLRRTTDTSYWATITLSGTPLAR